MAARPRRQPSRSGLFTAALVTLGLFWVWSRIPHPKSAAPADGLALRGVRLVDPGNPSHGALRTVLIRGERIWRVAPMDTEVDPAYRLVEADGATLLPGFIEPTAFLSLEGRLPGDARPVAPEPALRQHLAAGVTTVLDLNSGRPLQREFRQREILLRLPNVLFAGPLYTGPDGWRPPGRTPWETNLVELTAPEEVDSAWRSHVTFGYDLCFISLEHPGLGHAAMGPKTLKALADRARQRGLPIVIHATTVEKMAHAVMVQPNLMVGSSRHKVMSPELIEAMRKGGTAWAPALGEVFNLWPERKIAPELRRYDSLGPLEKDTRASLLKIGRRRAWIRPHVLDDTNRELMLDNVRRVLAAGVPVVAGSLAGLPGVTHGRGLHREMDWLMEAGLSPAQAAAGASWATARALGLKDRGEIRVGRMADLVLLDGDPMEDPTAHRRVKATVVRGRLAAHGEDDG